MGSSPEYEEVSTRRKSPRLIETNTESNNKLAKNNERTVSSETVTSETVRLEEPQLDMSNPPVESSFEEIQKYLIDHPPVKDDYQYQQQENLNKTWDGFHLTPVMKDVTKMISSLPAKYNNKKKSPKVSTLDFIKVISTKKTSKLSTLTSYISV